jgi:hypothetical protein
VTAFCAISESIDNMRSVYKNVGETGSLVGLYPYEPLHDMLRALQTLEPRMNPTLAESHRTAARKDIIESWYALREQFLEELELEPPDNPLLVPQENTRRNAPGGGAPAIAGQNSEGPSGCRARDRQHWCCAGCSRHACVNYTRILVV